MAVSAGISTGGIRGDLLLASGATSGDEFLGRRTLSGAMVGRVVVVILYFPSISKFGHSFCPKYVGRVLKSVVMSWEDKSGHGSPPGSSIVSSGLPSTSKF